MRHEIGIGMLILEGESGKAFGEPRGSDPLEALTRYQLSSSRLLPPFFDQLT